MTTVKLHNDMQKMIDACNKRSPTPTSCISQFDCGPVAFAALRNCTVEEALAWLKLNAQDLGGGWFRVKGKP